MLRFFHKYTVFFFMKGSLMKKRALFDLHHYPTLAALLGITLGTLLFLVLPRNTALLPIPTLDAGIFASLMRGFYKEGLPLFLALILYHLTKQKGAILFAVGWRALLFSLSTLQTASLASLSITAVYLLLHTAILLAHIAAGIALLTKNKTTGYFPFLYFMGLILLLTVIRLLTFTLLL